MKVKFLIGLIVFLILINGCSEHWLDCKENQYYDASQSKCKKIINECYTDDDCLGYETCVRTAIRTDLACKIGGECPKWYHNVCELTGDTILYCEKDSDCVWAFAPNSCCFCPMVYNRNILETEFKELVIYEKGKDYSSLRTIDCEDILCELCAPITELECVNNRCEKIV